MKFATITNIDQIKKAVGSDPQWKIKTKGDFIFCSYRSGIDAYANYDTDPQVAMIKREIRGLVFCSKTGKLVSRPFHKFFNVNENEESNEKNIKLGQKFWLLEKMDGSMCQPLLCRIESEDQFILRFSTKMGFDNPCTKYIEEFLYGTRDITKFPKIIQKNDKYEIQACEMDIKENYLKFLLKWMPNYTPIFEWCSNKCKIVLDHKQDMLVLLALRHNETGKYIPYEEMKKDAESFNVTCIKELSLDKSKFKSISQVVDHVSNIKFIEGVVLRLEDDSMYKIKTKWYHFAHKAKMHLQWNSLSEAAVWILVLDNQVDDVLPVLNTDDDRKLLKDFSKSLWEAVYKKSAEMQKYVDDFKKTNKTQKEFAEYVKTTFENPFERSILFKIWQGADAIVEVKKIIKQRANKRIEEARTLLKGKDNNIIKYSTKYRFFD